MAFHIAAIALTFVNQWIGVALYVLVAMVRLVPDGRFERLVESKRSYPRIAFSFSATEAARSA